ncbi:hypothetical protein [Candidatus Endomicrobiellum agilis]|uniref:hypothetical protein n=1 Tax=Candidatus Endomicrobiellum agilis TaxID=3238957 RepID=UPI00358CC8E9|nr:hypothetical protein [Endomicrobium sp.]
MKKVLSLLLCIVLISGCGKQSAQNGEEARSAIVNVKNDVPVPSVTVNAQPPAVNNSFRGATINVEAKSSIRTVAEYVAALGIVLVAYKLFAPLATCIMTHIPLIGQAYQQQTPTITMNMTATNDAINAVKAAVEQLTTAVGNGFTAANGHLQSVATNTGTSASALGEINAKKLQES